MRLSMENGGQDRKIQTVEEKKAAMQAPTPSPSPAPQSSMGRGFDTDAKKYQRVMRDLRYTQLDP